jgi:AraC-like DNA-binding protein
VDRLLVEKQAIGFDLVHADILRWFPDLVRQLGGDPIALAAEAGIDFSALFRGVSRVGYRSMINLLEHAAATLGCPDFGLRLARLQGGVVCGPVSAVMQNSNTFGDALNYVATHCHAHSLAARVRLERDRMNGKLFVGHEILLEGLPNQRQTIEQMLLLGHLQAMAITGGKARAREIHFRNQQLSSLQTLRRYFGCQIRFDQKEDGIVFGKRDLLCPIVAPDEQLYEKVRMFIDENFTREAPIHARVRGVILQFIESEGCDKERVATELHLHPRTLLRRLRNEGKSFEEIRDEVRRDMALRYLCGTDLPLRRIAEKLGYAEQSVLTRSCTRWFAASPREIRAKSLRLSSLSFRSSPDIVLSRSVESSARASETVIAIH